jgi:hypothetical protein
MVADNRFLTNVEFITSVRMYSYISKYLAKGSKTILPSSITGSRRHLHGLALDALATVAECGAPTFFTTFSCFQENVRNRNGQLKSLEDLLSYHENLIRWCNSWKNPYSETEDDEYLCWRFVSSRDVVRRLEGC